MGEKLTTGLALSSEDPLVPVPERLTSCGLPTPLSVSVTDAVKDPEEEGSNSTLMVQVPCSPKLVPQLLPSIKQLGLAPASEIPEMLSVAVPVFFTVMLFAELVVPVVWLPKARLLAERLTRGLAIPVPERSTDCGLPLALSTTVTAAVIDPVLIGEKTTLIVHVAPAARLVPQLLV